MISKQTLAEISEGIVAGIAEGSPEEFSKWILEGILGENFEGTVEETSGGLITNSIRSCRRDSEFTLGEPKKVKIQTRINWLRIIMDYQKFS